MTVALDMKRWMESWSWGFSVYLIGYFQDILCKQANECEYLNRSRLTSTFRSREVSLESIFKAPGRKFVCYVSFFSESTSKMSLFISLHDSFTWGAMAWLLIRTALTRTKVISRKVMNGLNRKTSLSKGFSKRRSAKILVFRLSLQKSWYDIVWIERGHYSTWLIHTRRHGRWQELYNPLWSCFSKSTERPKAKYISLESPFKECFFLCPDAGIALQKSTRKFLHIWLTVKF